MADSPKIDPRLNRLQALIDQVPTISERSPADELFLAWRDDCLDALTESMGRDHTLTRDLQVLRFRIHPELLGRMGSELSEVTGAHVSIDDLPFFRKSVYEAQEILLAALIDLRGRSSTPVRGSQ